MSDNFNDSDFDDGDIGDIGVIGDIEEDPIFDDNFKRIVELPIRLTREDLTGFVKTVHKLAQLSNDGRFTIKCTSPIVELSIEDVQTPAKQIKNLADLNGLVFMAQSDHKVRIKQTRNVDMWLSELGKMEKSVDVFVYLLEKLENPQ